MSTRSVIQTYMDKMRDGDFVGAFEMFSPMGTYTIIGNTPVSKTFTGRTGSRKSWCRCSPTGSRICRW